MSQPTPQSTEDLLPVVYERLRALAGRMWAERQSDASLDPTMLVHEVYLKLADHAGGWSSPAHLTAVAARAMRYILADRAKARGRQKRGGGLERVTLSGLGDLRDMVDLVAVDMAITQLEQLDPRRADVLVLRALGGLSVEEVAEVLGMSERTIKADWRLARAWLVSTLEAGEAP